MKKLLVLILLLAFPLMVFADGGSNDSTNNNQQDQTNDSSNDTNNDSSNDNSDDKKDDVTSPKTGVEDYFLTLGVVCVTLGGTLYILNKKNVFQEI